MTTFDKMSSNDGPSTPINNNSNFGMTEPTNENEANRLALIDDLKLFLATAANSWDTTNTPLKRFHLPTGESISCVLWNGLYFVTGTDIVRSLTFRFHAFGRPITNTKKFEEGIFSDLRNLKPGIDARLEEPKSDLLDMLYKNNCIRTQKKQKVFFWYSVPHDRLFLDALERDLKREKIGLESTTTAVAEPATSTSLDTTQELFDQLRKSMSISAAATAHALEEEVNNNCITLDANMSSNSSSPSLSSLDDHRKQNEHPSIIPTSTKTTAYIDPALSERIQTRRSRVNSVPADFGQDQDPIQQHLIQQQQKHQRQRYRMSHGSYFAPPSSLATSRPRQRAASSASSSLTSGSSPTSLTFDDNVSATERPSSSLSFNSDHSSSQDTLVDRVHQLDIANRQQHKQPRRSQHHHHQASHSNQRVTSGGVLPSKSLDSNTLKKTKTIFGAHSLFDGSPTYKQRRRRATSVSSSMNQQQLPQQQSSVVSGGGGGPDRIRRHTNCHLRTSSTASMHGNNTNTVNNAVHQPTSRLAMAAMAAGFGNKQHSNHHHHYNAHQQPQPQAQSSHHHHQQYHPRSHQPQQQSYQAPNSSSGLMMPQSWSAMMDTSFPGLEDDGLTADSMLTNSTKHTQLQHSDYSCELCGKLFQCLDTLNQHRKTHDNNVLHHGDYVFKHETDDDMDDQHYHRRNLAHQQNYRQEHYGTTYDVLASGTGSTVIGANVASHGGMYQQFGQRSNSVNGSQPSGIATSSTSNACALNGEGMVSPVEDMDSEMKDALTVDTSRPYQQHYSPYGSPGQSDHGLTPIATDLHSTFSTDFMLSYGTGNFMLSPEDELSSSSSSSPSSILHYQGYYDVFTGSSPLSNGNDGPVLLSSFKPEHYTPTTTASHQYHPQHPFYQPLTQPQHQYNHSLPQGMNDFFYPSSSSSSTSSYYPTLNKTICDTNNNLDYTPLTTTPDMATVFN